ncbi:MULTISPECIES: LysE family translocator [Brasilonema]|nr:MULTISPECIES: LysE family transporter [Brasilonema]
MNYMQINMMQFLGDWLTIFTAGCLVIMSPRPNFVLTLRNSLAHSRQAGIYTALGVTAGDLIHVICWLIGSGNQTSIFVNFRLV